MKAIAAILSARAVRLVCMAAVVLAARAGEVAPRQPDRRELWVPTAQLAKVLGTQKAVLLSREQYEALLRDAGAAKPARPLAPRTAVLSAANYRGAVEGRTLVISAEIIVNVLNDGFAALPLDFRGAALADATLDGGAAFAAAGGKDEQPAMLIVSGRGEHKLAFTLTAPVQTAGGRSSLALIVPPAASGEFHVRLPAKVAVESAGLPLKIEPAGDATLLRAVLTPQANTIAATWNAAGAVDAGAVPMSAKVEVLYELDSEKANARSVFSLASQLGDLPVSFEFTVPPAARILVVDAPEIAAWEASDGRVKVTLQPGARRSVDVRIEFEIASLAGADAGAPVLPVPGLAGIPRLEGEFGISADESVVVRDVVAGTKLRRVPNVSDTGRRGFFNAFRFDSLPPPPRVMIERAKPRTEADVDTLVRFRTDAVFIERTITLRDDRGRSFSAVMTLPDGEELTQVMAVAAASVESEPEWRADGNKVTISWSDESQAARVFRVRSRVEPAGWTKLPEEGLPFVLGDVKIGGVSKVTGYVALDAAGAFRIEAQPGETLERRDGRVTPVRGAYAWFRRDVMELAVRVFKRPAQVLASLTGYALPLEGVLDVHAAMNYEFLHGGTRSVKLRVPAELAQNFQFDGPQIAERTLAGDVWTITFQKDLTGAYELAISAQVPVAKKADADGGQGYSFVAKVPVIAPLDVTRSSGLWAVEANTETEIHFETKGLNEVDSLHAPRLGGYAPSHRVIGVFGWLGSEYSLTLRGVRHAAAAVLKTVVDQFDLDTVVSTGGLHRHEAALKLRTAGAQHLDVALPEKAALLSLVVDGAPVKPVADRPGVVRVQLPAKAGANVVIAVTLLYETPAEALGTTGKFALAAPRLAKEIPILRSEWRLWLPEGFSYTDFDSNLGKPEPERESVLIAKFGAGIVGTLGTRWYSMGSIKHPASAAMSRADSDGMSNPKPRMAVPADDVRQAVQSPQLEMPPNPDQPKEKLVANADARRRVGGLLPVLIDLPKAGQPLVFGGLYAPENVSVRYDSWWSRARRLWFWFVGGGVTFYFVARLPWRASVWAVLLLSAVPLCGLPAWTAVCNAALGGWLAALLLNRIGAWCVFRGRREVLA